MVTYHLYIHIHVSFLIFGIPWCLKGSAFRIILICNNMQCVPQLCIQEAMFSCVQGRWEVKPGSDMLMVARACAAEDEGDTGSRNNTLQVSHFCKSENSNCVGYFGFQWEGSWIHAYLRKNSKTHQWNKKHFPPLSLPLALFQTTLTCSTFINKISHYHIY